MFVDADDLLAKDALDVCYNVQKKYNVDVVSANWSIIDGNGKESVTNNSSSFGIVAGNLLQKDILAYKKATNLWGRLYNRKVVTGKQFMQLSTGEDLLFLVDVFGTKDCKILTIPHNIYRYRILKNSLSHKASSKRLLENQSFSNELEKRISKDKSLEQEYAQALQLQVLWRLGQKGWFPVLNEIDKKHLFVSCSVLNIKSQFLEKKGLSFMIYSFIYFFRNNMRLLLRNILHK